MFLGILAYIVLDQYNYRREHSDRKHLIQYYWF